MRRSKEPKTRASERTAGQLILIDACRMACGAAWHASAAVNPISFEPREGRKRGENGGVKVRDTRVFPRGGDLMAR